MKNKILLNEIKSFLENELRICNDMAEEESEGCYEEKAEEIAGLLARIEQECSGKHLK